MAFKKLTEELFLKILTANGGLATSTARAIEEQLGIPYTRQAVFSRAKKYPEELASMRGELIDIAEGKLREHLNSDNEMISLKAVEFTLKTIGKGRGYSEKQEIEINAMPEIIINFTKKK